MARKKELDNVAFVRDLMSRSNFGPLAEMFVIDALAKWSKIISESDPAALENGLVNGAAWQGVAKEIQAKLDARNAPRPRPIVPLEDAEHDTAMEEGTRLERAFGDGNDVGG